MKLLNLFLGSSLVEAHCLNGCSNEYSQVLNRTYCQNEPGRSFFGTHCERPEPSLLCKEHTIAIQMDDDSNRSMSSIAYVGRRRKRSIHPELENPLHDPAGRECRFNHISRNGKLFLEIDELQYEKCGIMPSITQDHRAVQFNGLVWQNIDSEVLSQPRILFDFMCLYTVIGHTSQLKDPPKIDAIRDENHTPIIVRSHQQTVPIRLYYSPPGLVSRREIEGGFPRSPSMISEWIFASVDLRQSHVAEYFDLTIDDCFIKSSGDEDKLNIQIIEDGRPMFSFVKMHDQTHGELHFSLRVFKVELVLDYLDY